MLYEENLEIHFWDWKTYDKSKVINFLKYILKNQTGILEFRITAIDFDINNLDITEDIYENKRIIKKFSLFDIENDNELKEILENNFVEEIIFNCFNNIKKYFFIHYSQNNIYYSYEFPVEDLINDTTFFSIKALYLDLIDIFQPIISNCWFVVLWEDAERIKKTQSFEWFCWYIQNELKFDFIIMKKIINYNNWILFLKN